MKVSIKLFTSESVTAEGYPIYIRVSHINKRVKRCVGHSFEDFWNTDKHEPLKTHPDYFNLMPMVLDYKSKISKIKFSEYTFNQALEFLFDEKSEDSTGFLEFFDIIIEEKKIKKQPFQSFLDVKNVISNFVDGDISLSLVNYEWLNKFILYKLSNGTGQGGVMSYLRTMRSVYKEAQRRTSYNLSHVNPFSGLIKSVTPKRKTEIKIVEISKLKYLKPKLSTTKENAIKMRRNVAIWFFQLYIGGHDYIDIALLKWGDISNNRISFRRFKNRNKLEGGPLIDNLLLQQALDVIDLYGTPENQRVFGFIPDPVNNEAHYINFRRTINDSLSRISKIVGFERNITTKTTRYIFRTAAGEKLVHDLIVMKLQGHKPEGISYKYQGNISYSVQDKAHLEILESVI